MHGYPHHKSSNRVLRFVRLTGSEEEQEESSIERAKKNCGALYGVIRVEARRTLFGSLTKWSARSTGSGNIVMCKADREGANLTRNVFAFMDHVV
jgi:hypothetical protein